MVLIKGIKLPFVKDISIAIINIITLLEFVVENCHLV